MKMKFYAAIDESYTLYTYVLEVKLISRWFSSRTLDIFP